VPNGFSALHEARVPASHGALLWRQDLRHRKQGGTHPTRSKPDNGQIDLLHNIPHHRPQNGCYLQFAEREGVNVARFPYLSVRSAAKIGKRRFRRQGPVDQQAQNISCGR
jgi:hypothetical protein